MYVSDQTRKIEYLGNGVVNLPPGASCEWVVDALVQQEDEDGYDLEGKPWRAECSRKRSIFRMIGHWRVLMNDGPEETSCFDLDEDVPEDVLQLFWDGPSAVKWYSSPRELPEDGHFHWFDVTGHDGYRIHCSLQDEPQPAAGATVPLESDEGLVALDI